MVGVLVKNFIIFMLERAKKRVQFLPNALTAFGLACGLYVIYWISQTSITHANVVSVLHTSAMILLVAAMADVLDGAVARSIEAESAFGVQFDSLSDAITFGIAPGVIVLKTLLFDGPEGLSFLVTTGAMIYSFCGILRLVRFNVQTAKNEEDEDSAQEMKKNFIGLPIPAGAATVISSNFFFVCAECQSTWPIEDQTRSLIMVGVMILSGYLMVSRVRFPSLKRLKFRINSFSHVLSGVFFTALILYGILNHFAVVLFAVSWVYISMAFFCAFFRSLRRKSKTS